MSDSLQQLGVALDGRDADLNSSLSSIDQAAANLRPLERQWQAPTSPPGSVPGGRLCTWIGQFRTDQRLAIGPGDRR